MSKKLRIIENTFENYAKILLKNKEIESVPIEQIKEEIRSFGVGGIENGNIQEAVNYWSRCSRNNKCGNRNSMTETLRRVADVYLEGEEYVEFKEFLQAPNGPLYQDLKSKIELNDRSVSSLIVSIIGYFDAIFHLPPQKREEFLSQFPKMNAEEYACSGGSQSRIGSLMIRMMGNEYLIAFEGLVSSESAKLSRFVVMGNNIHIPSLLKEVLLVKSKDSAWKLPIREISASDAWKFVNGFDDNFQRIFYQNQEDKKRSIIELAHIFDDVDDLANWKNKLAIHCDVLEIEKEELFDYFLNEESYDLKHNVVKEKLEEVVKNLILKSIQIEEKLDLDILSREAPEKISRILKDENSSPNKKRLAIKALWILSADFPGNSKINFLKSLTSFGYDGEIESFEDLSDDDVRKSLDYCFDKFPEMIKNIEFKDVWGFLREISDSQNSIVRSADFGVNFYDMVQERLKIIPFAESFGDEYLDFYRSSNDGGRTILLPALGELSSDEIFYHPKRSEILDLLKFNKDHLVMGSNSSLDNSNILAHNVWNEIFLKAVEKQDVVFLEEVLVMGADINIDFSQSISEAFKISVKTQNKDLFRTFIADPNVSESLRYALLFAAIKNGLDQFSEIILEHSIGDINRTDLAEDDDLL
ncbi:MAG: hypothetical protein ACJAVG_000418, partial [Rickettsiales bacterium]